MYSRDEMNRAGVTQWDGPLNTSMKVELLKNREHDDRMRRRDEEDHRRRMSSSENSSGSSSTDLGDLLSRLTNRIDKQEESIAALNKELEISKAAWAEEKLEVLAVKSTLEALQDSVCPVRIEELLKSSREKVKEHYGEIFKKYGANYNGEVKAGKRHGFGTYQYSDGVYEGEWVDDKRCGKGIFHWPDGDVFEGDYLEDKRTGKGIFRWADGDVFEGDYLEGKITGKGILRWADGNVYEGDFLENKRTGKGIYRWADGDVYEGDFLEGKKTGTGILHLTNGDVYEGEYENDKFCAGIRKFKNGDWERVSKNGDWERGKFEVDGDTFILQDGKCRKAFGSIVYEGGIKMDKPFGIGKVKFADGAIFEGEWAFFDKKEPTRLYGKGVVTEPDEKKKKATINSRWEYRYVGLLGRVFG